MADKFARQYQNQFSSEDDAFVCACNVLDANSSKMPRIY